MQKFKIDIESQEIIQFINYIHAISKNKKTPHIIFSKNISKKTKDELNDKIDCLLSNLNISDHTLNTLSAIKSLNSLIIKDISLDRLCKNIVEILVIEVGFDNASILLYDPEKEELKFTAAYGKEDINKKTNFNRSLAFKPGIGIAGKAFEQGHTIFASNNKKIDSVKNSSLDLKSIVSIPLIYELKKIGVLNLSFSKKTQIDINFKKEIEIIKGVISYIILSYKKDKELINLNKLLKENIRFKDRYHLDLINLLPIGLCELIYKDKFLYIHKANPAFMKIIKIKPKTIDYRLIDFFTNKEIYYKAQSSLLIGNNFKKSNCILKQSDKIEFIGDIFLSQISFKNIYKYYFILLDKTEEHILEQKLVQSDKINSLGTLASGVAHDVKNIFSGVNMAVQILKNKKKNIKFESRYIDMIEDAANRGITLSTNLLNFAKGKQPVLENLNIIDIIKNCINLLKSSIDSSIKIEVIDPDYNLPTIKGDSSQLEQVFFNILINAKDAIKARGNIYINFRYVVRPEKEIIIIEIKDTGKGMSKDIINKIFDPFFTTKKKSQGTGLGLSIAYRILQNHNGDITVKSNIGEGTTFFIGLPVSKNFTEESHLLQILTEVKGNNEKILLIDDDYSVANSTADMLREYNFQVNVVYNGYDALEYISKGNKLHVILLDILMPKFNGIETLKSIRKINKEILIILTTVLSKDKDIKENISKFNPIRYLRKPYTIVQLINIINEFKK